MYYENGADVTDRLNRAWAINSLQFYGNDELPLIFNDPDFDDHNRLPVPLEETIKDSYIEEAKAQEQTP